MSERATHESNPLSPEFRERPQIKIYDRPTPPVPWLTPIVIPALLLLLVATVLIYLLVL